MYKTMTAIEGDEMAWNEHDQLLDTEIKVFMPSWQEK